MPIEFFELCCFRCLQWMDRDKYERQTSSETKAFKSSSSKRSICFSDSVANQTATLSKRVKWTYNLGKQVGSKSNFAAAAATTEKTR